MIEDCETDGAEAADPEKGPLRLCAVSRVQKSPDELIRFVADPEQSIVPDLARRLPGRGVWIDATRQALDKAIQRGIFAKSLKHKVSVAPDLADRVERLLLRRLADALSLANKAGLVVAGFAKVEAALDAGGVALLLHARDGAEDGISKLDRRFRAIIGDADLSIRICKELTSAEMSLALGRLNVVHAAASEGGASRRIQQEAGRLRRFRTAGD